MPRPQNKIKWPEGINMVVAPIVPWEVWPENLGTPQSHQQTNRPPVPANARYKRDMWAVFDHEYGDKEGIWNLMEMFKRNEIKATIVANGKSVEEHPDIAKELEEEGHEMSSENYLHEYAICYTREEEEEDIRKNVEAFEKVLGHKPYGYISPGHMPSEHTLEILADAGYIWDADFQNSDEPFIMEVKGKKMVGMPYAHISDYNTYQFHGRTPRMMQEMLKDDFDFLYEQGKAGAPKMLGYAFHPFLCHGYRLKPLEEFFQYAKSFPGVWIARRLDITNWILENFS